VRLDCAAEVELLQARCVEPGKQHVVHDEEVNRSSLEIILNFLAFLLGTLIMEHKSTREILIELLQLSIDGTRLC
jgi:hypothetical protein